VLIAVDYSLRAKENNWLVFKENLLLTAMDKWELSMWLISNGIWKSLLPTLEKHTEFLGKKYIGRFGHISISLNVINARNFFLWQKWVTVNSILNSLTRMYQLQVHQGLAINTIVVIWS
jgi:hypothetical protein